MFLSACISEIGARQIDLISEVFYTIWVSDSNIARVSAVVVSQDVRHRTYKQ